MFKSKIYLTILVLVGIFLSLQIYYTCRRATEGDELAELESQTQTLEIENEQLREVVHSATSMLKIEEFAHTQHMTPINVASLGQVAVAAASKTHESEN